MAAYRAFSVYNDTLAERICERICNGEKIKTICQELGVEYPTVAHWQRANTKGFRTRLNNALQDRILLLQDEVLEIADACPLTAVAVNRATLQVRARMGLIERFDKRVMKTLDLAADDNEPETKPETTPADFMRAFRERQAS